MIWLIAIVLVFLPAYLVRFSVFGLPTTLLEIGIWLGLVWFMIERFRLNRQHASFQLGTDRSIGQFLIASLLFLISGGLGVLVSPDKRLALGQFKGFIVDPMILGFLVWSTIGRTKDGLIFWNKRHSVARFWLAALVGGGLIVAVVGIAEYLFGLTPADGRVLSVFRFDLSASPNYLALLLSPIAPISFWLGLSRRGLLIRLVYWLAWLAMIGAVYLAGSRGGLIGLATGSAVVVIVCLKSQSLKQLLWLSLASLIALSFYLARPDLSASPESARVASSNNIRWEIWKTSAEIISQSRPNFVFGIGLGNYQNYFTNLTQDRVNYPEFIAPRALHPHNILLALWFNLGLLGLAAFVWLVYLVIKFSIFNFQFSNRSLKPALAGAMTALLVHGLVDTPYFKNDLSIIFWILIGLTVSQLTIGQKSKN